MRFGNSNLLERNQDMKAEIEALQAHCNVLNGQNGDLNGELERFVQTDEQIRATLNRREQVGQLGDKTTTAIQKSQYELDRASPQRRR